MDEEWEQTGPEAAGEMVLGAGPGPSAGFSLTLPQENEMCSLFKFETCQWAPSLPHQSPGKWRGSRVGGDLGVGYVIKGEEMKLSDRVTWK